MLTGHPENISSGLDRASFTVILGMTSTQLETLLHLAARAGLLVEHDGGGDVVICGWTQGVFHGVVIEPDGNAYDLVTHECVDPMIAVERHQLVSLRYAV